MEQILVLIIFGIISLVGHFMSKAQEAAKEKQREEEGPTLSRDQIPPETRRQLYGDDDDDVPMARPRGEAPQRRIPPVARPAVPRRSLAESPDLENRPSLEDMPSFDEAPMRREATPPPRPAPPRRPTPPMPPAAPQPRTEHQQHVPQTHPQRQAAQPRPQPQPAAQAPAYATPVAPVAASPDQQRAAAQRAQAQRAQAPVEVRPATGARQLLATREDLRRAILAREIIGAPRSQAPYEPVC